MNPGGLCCWSFWGGGPGVFLILCGFVVYTTERFMFWGLPVLFVLVFLHSFWHCDHLTWGGWGAGLCDSRAFVCFVRVGLCSFSLPLSVGDWLRFVIVALPGLFY